MNKTQTNQTEIKKEKTNAFKRFFNRHETALEIAMVISLTSTSALGASYLGVKNQENNLVYKDVEMQNVKEDKSETITFKEPLRRGKYSTNDNLANKMFGELEQKTEVKIGDETFYLSSVDKNRRDKHKDELIIILKNKETDREYLIEEKYTIFAGLIKVNGEMKNVSITLDTVDTEEGKKLNGIKIKYF